LLLLTGFEKESIFRKGVADRVLWGTKALSSPAIFSRRFCGAHPLARVRLYFCSFYPLDGEKTLLLLMACGSFFLDLTSEVP